MRSAKGRAMPTLLEIQDAVYRSLVQRDCGPASPHIRDDGLAPEARLNVYRNTFIGSLTTALRLSYPAVHRLVGAEFFESAARLFIEAHPPRSACLDTYGADLPGFIASFEPAESLPYLPGVARLEWAVNTALHAPDTPTLDLSSFAALDPIHHDRVILVPHPAISLVREDYPVDAIWSAVLAQDDAAMASVELGSGLVWLLVDRRDGAVGVRRIDEPPWHFLETLCAGQPALATIEAATEVDGTALLAEHLAAGRFARFELIENDDVTSPSKSSPHDQSISDHDPAARHGPMG
jgi:hypothetical protein